MPKMRTLTLLGAALLIGCSGPTRPPDTSSRPFATIWIDSIEVDPRRFVDMYARASTTDESAIPFDTIGGLHLSIYYEKQGLVLQALEPDSGLSGWEYYTYRVTSPRDLENRRFGLIQIEAIRDLDDGVPAVAYPAFPAGPLFHLEFMVTNDYDLVGQRSEVGFWSDDCEDNTFYGAGNSRELLVANTALSPDQPRLNFDTLTCRQNYTLHPALAFHGGWSHIVEASDGRPALGDINLDGLHYMMNDYTTYLTYFLRGTSFWTELDSVEALEQSDCNYDRRPLSVADLEFLERVNEDQISWRTMISPLDQDSVVIWTKAVDGHRIITASSSAPISAVWLQVELSEDFAVGHLRFLQENSWYQIMQFGTTLRILIRSVSETPLFGIGEARLMELSPNRVNYSIVAVQASVYPGVPIRALIAQ